MSERSRRRVLVSGRVQGVWFRDTCRRVAVQHGVAGWVRNLHDERVEAVFEGDADAVDALEAWCHQGPASARVTRVEATDEEPEGETAFHVRP